MSIRTILTAAASALLLSTASVYAQGTAPAADPAAKAKTETKAAKKAAKAEKKAAKKAAKTEKKAAKPKKAAEPKPN